MKPRQEEGEENKVEDPDNLSRSETALQHLPCLLEFLDNHIAQKQSFLNSAGCEKVSFSDIWHLFKPGDFVISADGKQVYRVVRVFAPRHKGTNPWAAYMGPRSNQGKPYSEDIIISCVYIHFNGTHLGPVLETFPIKKFDGEKSVTSLDIYPLRFHVLRDLEVRKVKNTPGNTELEDLISSKVDGLRHSLINRGKLFVEVTAVKHMYYSGFTVDTRDEIESQVMIDFEEAFSVERNKRWRPQITRLLGLTISEEESIRGEVKRCEAECCWLEAVHDDSVYVEDKRQRDFINRMMAEIEDNRRKLPSVAVFPRSLEDIKSEATPLTDDELLIMSYQVFGFILRDRSWGKFSPPLLFSDELLTVF